MLSKCGVFVAASAVVLQFGCTNYEPKPLSAAANARVLESRSLDDPRLKEFVAAALAEDGAPAAAPLRWRLMTLTLAALYFHPDIKLAQTRLSRAAAAIVTAQEPPNPVLNLTNQLGAAAVAGAIPAGAAPVTLGPVIDLVLETAGKREARTAQAQDLADAARHDIASAQWQVLGHVRDALLDLWAAKERAALTRQRLALQDQLVQLLEHRLGEGAASSLDVARERIARAQIALALSDLDRIAAEARARLAGAIGIPERGLDGVNPDLSAFDRAPPRAAGIDRALWRKEALIGRSDVQASLAEYAAAQDALRLAIAGQYPNIRLGPGYNYDLGVNRFILDLGATLPLFHQSQGAIAEAAARREEAAAAFTALQARTIAAIDAAEAAYAKATESVAAGDSILADETRRAERVETAFRAGQVDRPTLLTARLEVAATALSRFDAIVRQRQALGALEDALQHPLYEPRTSLPAPPELSS